LGHLGLVAALYDVSIGQAVKAMVLNGLGFAEHALYLTPHFFKDKPIERLIFPNIRAEQLNDTTFGRAMDSIYQQDISEIFSQISMKTVRFLNLDCRIGHVDTTRSFNRYPVVCSTNSDEKYISKQVFLVLFSSWVFYA